MENEKRCSQFKPYQFNHEEEHPITYSEYTIYSRVTNQHQNYNYHVYNKIQSVHDKETSFTQTLDDMWNKNLHVIIN
jgi:hypothetical protein